MHNTIDNFERIVLDTCSECGRVSTVMYRLRTGFTVTGLVCQSCYSKYYSKNRVSFMNFTKTTDKAVTDGQSLPGKSGFMRLHQSSNFLSEESKEQQKQKKKNSRLNSATGESLKYNLEAYYYLVDKSELSISGMYQVLEYTNKGGDTLRVYYTIHNDQPIARFLMDSRGKIIQYF